MTIDNLEIPPNATIRQEYVKCGNPDCQNSHGPYLYAYWKQDKKLKKRYVGKNREDFAIRRIAKEVKLKPSQYTKFIFIQGEADKGNVLAKQYLEKLRKEEVSIDWAHRVLISSIRQQRMLKMMAIADDRHFIYDNEVELVQFIASEMKKEGLDLNNEENLDSYLNTKFM
jgi:NAD(P)H-flavin reductase